MPTSIQTRVEKLRERKRDRTSGEVRLRNDVLGKSNLRLHESSQDAIAYLQECMQEVPQTYTLKTFEECKRVENQIRKALESDCNENSFDHQGSVTTNTHVKFHSDIDLLVACRKFVYCTPPYVPHRPYAGSPIDDLKNLRKGISETLTKSFPEAKVETNGGKAISIEGGSLTRKIDIVPCAWEESRESLAGDKRYKGISIYDVKLQQRISNLPFLHNAQIDSKDLATKGALKGLIRIIKSVRYDSDADIPVSSYDIAALCYNLPPDFFSKFNALPSLLCKEFLNFCNVLIEREDLRLNLKVPNATRLIFGTGGVKLEGFKILRNEVAEVLEKTERLAKL